MENRVLKMKRGSVAPCMTCPLCRELFHDATTIMECLHTFCKKCILKKLLDEDTECCPVCSIHLGCAPLDKLRPDHTLQDVRAKLFPYERRQGKAPEVATPVTIPAKRKERSISSLVVSTQRDPLQSGMTERRSNATARKASRGSSDHRVCSSSREDLAKSTRNARQSSTVSKQSDHPICDQGRENICSEVCEGKLDIWKPLTCLVEAATRRTQESAAISESHDNESGRSKTKHEEDRLKSNAEAENCTVHVPQEAERPEKSQRGHHKKGEDIGESSVPPQLVLDASSANFGQKNHHIWFSLVASVDQDGNAPLPQIAPSYLRVKDGSKPVSMIQKYLKGKLDLTSENEVEIKCMGQTVIPSLTLNNLVELWLRTTGEKSAPATIGSSAKDFVMVLCYARR